MIAMRSTKFCIHAFVILRSRSYSPLEQLKDLVPGSIAVLNLPSYVLSRKIHPKFYIRKEQEKSDLCYSLLERHSGPVIQVISLRGNEKVRTEYSS
jgi:hypothetical protein